MAETPVAYDWLLEETEEQREHYERERLKKRHFVYAIGAMSSDYQVEAVKIGITSGRRSAVVERARDLSIGNHRELDVLGQVELHSRQAASDLELSIHINFKYAKLRGEWFKPTDALSAFIKERMKSWFSVNYLDRKCMQFWDAPGSGHYLDADDRCPCGTVSRDWEPA